MRTPRFIGICAAIVALSLGSCHDEDKADAETKSKTPAIKEENVAYTGDGVTMNGYIAYDSNSTEKRPVVLVVHEWWGLNDYAKSRVKQLAELGYIAMAVDMFAGKTADNPTAANDLAGPFYGNTTMAKNRFDAALAKIKAHSLADPKKVAAIGYCFGGAMVLTMAKLGDSLNGVVSFHGNLNVVPANKDLLKAKILVCHGDADPFVSKEEVAAFKKQMDSIGASYTFKAYPDATHAFTNPKATEVGKKFNIPIAYNAAADSASWKDMKEFFGTIFK